MKVFISWSGRKSLAVAEVLKVWLPSVLQALDEVWLSDEDIRSGQNWSKAIGEKLSATDFGIVCVTQENQERPWLNFEAGAISKLVGGAVPLLIDFVKKTDLKAGPLSQLQVRMANEEDIFKLVRDVNALLVKPLEQHVLETVFKRAYSELESKVKEILNDPAYQQHVAPRGNEDKLDEVLGLLRGLNSNLSRRPPIAGTWSRSRFANPVESEDFALTDATALIARHLRALNLNTEVAGLSLSPRSRHLTIELADEIPDRAVRALDRRIKSDFPNIQGVTLLTESGATYAPGSEDELRETLETDSREDAMAELRDEMRRELEREVRDEVTDEMPDERPDDPTPDD